MWCDPCPVFLVIDLITKRLTCRWKLTVLEHVSGYFVVFFLSKGLFPLLRSELKSLFQEYFLSFYNTFLLYLLCFFFSISYLFSYIFHVSFLYRFSCVTYFILSCLILQIIYVLFNFCFYLFLFNCRSIHFIYFYVLRSESCAYSVGA